MSQDNATSQRPAEDTLRQPKKKSVRRPVSAMIGALLVLFWLFVAAFGNFLAPFDPSDMVSQDIFASYSGTHMLGTDFLGRDMLSRILDGARYSVGLALISTVLACLTGVTLGLLAVLSNTWVDEAVSRIINAQQNACAGIGIGVRLLGTAANHHGRARL
jgi:peptide/nickel transport system permease protein